MSNLLQAHREQVGRQIKLARKSAHLTHDGLAAIVGTSRQHLIKLEKGQHAPRAEMLQKIADATGKEPAFFTENGDDEDEESATVRVTLNLPQDLLDAAVRRALNLRDRVAAA